MRGPLSGHTRSVRRPLIRSTDADWRGRCCHHAAAEASCVRFYERLCRRGGQTGVSLLEFLDPSQRGPEPFLVSRDKRQFLPCDVCASPPVEALSVYRTLTLTSGGHGAEPNPRATF